MTLLAADMEDAWRSLPEPPDLQKQPLLPLCAASPVHRALWLGGGGVGKTRTVPGDLLHADSLRSTYIRARVHRFSTAPYMRPKIGFLEFFLGPIRENEGNQ